MLYLYAFAEPPATLGGTAGIAGSELRAEPVDGVEAIVGTVADGVEAAQDAVLAHARVVDELALANAAVVPVRFGAGFSDAESLRNAVAPRVPALRDALRRVRGCVEIGLRVLAATPQVSRPSAVSGRDYMVGRLDEARRVERLADQLHAPLARLARASDHRVRATPQLLLSGAYLVPREDVAAFRDAVAELEAAHTDLSFACTGPWPAYSFGTIAVDER